ncbi:bifunctional tetrahydrofolate synthase/dihydrofolate synthase [Halomonas sp. 7T]|uniref:bifunctional tetrahydrofolate synthase/dihydrofolate synthase n=1 Tax=Halomonas sp. 7T TaxID=2893469 RepID=UPI0021DB0F66|nr:bifunctional tetrahydrofolate synthase/dihydrofolate synthase [Halomonas sp. 7T]UXZ55861.1 bifunctional tetrahydrofolate synthase/dihydrofolate synthase [Halomonas sp. 7T]
MPKSLAEWLHYLETLHPVGIDMGLERVSQVAKRMGLLESPIAPRVITVAGTNGKGSTLAMMDAIALAHGLRTGTYTSPHLLRYNERVTIDGQDAQDALLVAGFQKVESARLQSPTISLTYFEAGTLCALWCLAQANLDVALLEVGLGGRLDAVNIIDADVGVVTTIAQDHAHFLGTDIDQIGREKAGIFRPLKPAVLGSQTLPSSVAETAVNISAPVYLLGAAFHHTAFSSSDKDSAGRHVADANSQRRTTGVAAWSWHGLTAKGEAISFDGLPDPGLPIDNAATALQALAVCGVRLSLSHCNEALETVRLPGRMQWLGQWCLDVGHNPHAAEYLARRLPMPPAGGRQWALIGMLNDKDADGVIDALLPRITDWVCVTLEGERGRPAVELAERITSRGGKVHYCAASPEEGVSAIAERLTPQDRVLATGSFFTVAALLANPLPQA